MLSRRCAGSVGRGLSTEPPPAGTAQPAGGAASARRGNSPTPAAVPNAVTIAGLTRRFGERTVLRDLSVEVPTGATLAVLGRNGAGKSTLLRILSTLLRPHGGRVVLLGEELPRRAWAVRGRIGLLGHEPLLYRDLSGRENLQYHARLHGVGDERVRELLEAVQMGTRADEPVRLLSRGMVQRLAICRAVLHRPAVLLLDEPRSNLDPAAADLVAPLIGGASGATRVITSHDPGSALAEADVVLALRDGRCSFVGPPSELDSAALTELYT
jgi:ABC-type multidrug transport system ATPase subunit